MGAATEKAGAGAGVSATRSGRCKDAPGSPGAARALPPAVATHQVVSAHRDRNRVDGAALGVCGCLFVCVCASVCVCLLCVRLCV